jgi:argininosuccinate lyase
MSKEKAIWLFAGGQMQEPAALKIKSLGYRLIITDRSMDCHCARYADEMLALDTFDIPGNLRAAPALAKKFAIEAVLTAAADCHETVASVGRSLQLNALDPEIAHLCRYKQKTRAVLTQAGLPQPACDTVKDIDSARQLLAGFGGSGVLKATNNSGSRGFAAIQDPDALTPELFEAALDAGTSGLVIVEEKLEPVRREIAEQSLETVWYDGKMYFLNWVDRLFRNDFLSFSCLQSEKFYADTSWAVEIGHLNPALHSYETLRQVTEHVYRAGVAIGMHKQRGGHILKADIMLTERGPYIIELTPRLSGGWDSSASTPARGADFIGGAIMLALGHKLDLDLWHNHFAYRNPALFAAVLAWIEPGAVNCIGRKFSLGTGFQQEKALADAMTNLKEKRYVLPVE